MGHASDRHHRWASPTPTPVLAGWARRARRVRDGQPGHGPGGGTAARNAPAHRRLVAATPAARLPARRPPGAQCLAVVTRGRDTAREEGGRAVARRARRRVAVGAARRRALPRRGRCPSRPSTATTEAHGVAGSWDGAERSGAERAGVRAALRPCDQGRGCPPRRGGCELGGGRGARPVHHGARGAAPCPPSPEQRRL